jgi:hypothetical protein
MSSRRGDENVESVARTRATEQAGELVRQVQSWHTIAWDGATFLYLTSGLRFVVAVVVFAFIAGAVILMYCCRRVMDCSVLDLLTIIYPVNYNACIKRFLTALKPAGEMVYTCFQVFTTLKLLR